MQQQIKWLSSAQPLEAKDNIETRLDWVCTPQAISFSRSLLPSPNPNSNFKALTRLKTSCPASHCPFQANSNSLFVSFSISQRCTCPSASIYKARVCKMNSNNHCIRKINMRWSCLVRASFPPQTVLTWPACLRLRKDWHAHARSGRTFSCLPLRA